MDGKVVVMFMLVMGMVATQTYAVCPDLPTCFVRCNSICRLPPELCASRCLKQCLFHDTSDIHHYYCKLGCETAKCTSVSTLENPAGKEAVEECANSCSEICTGNTSMGSS
ncbi:hypothetical protein IFM89_011820 [Coptis chinensis]|uniref:Thionin-like protein 2 n=1 Tax=Coptis chinensis TaxID=261450 RepID=A0A835H2C1_9MAGN|nr:hypothetical protein IFM89_011820 [Coptis chinensis]